MSTAIKGGGGLTTEQRNKIQGIGFTFYVSNSGLASNDGLTEATAITPVRLLELLPSFTGGEKVLLKRGETFDLQIDLPKGGKPSNRTAFNAYGTGAKPVIRASESVGSLTWTEEGAGSGLWYAPLTTAPKWVFINGQEAKWAETPWYKITAQGTNTVTASILAGVYSGSLVGATVLIKEAEYRVSYLYTVTAFDNVTGQVTLDRNVTGAGVDHGFRLLNQKQFINENGEWWYDSVNARLYVKSAATPAGTDIRVSTKDYGINIADGVSNIEVNNIKFIHQRLGGVRGVNNHNISINACDFSDIRKNGVDLRGTCDNLKVSSCSFSRMGMNGISAAAGDRAVIENSTFVTMGMSPNFGIQDDTTWWKSSGLAIVSTFDTTLPEGKRNMQNGIIRGNTVSDTAYGGIMWYGSNHLVEYNIVSGYSKRFIDGGGIYSFSAPVYEVPNTNCTWRKNIIFGGVGNQEFTPTTGRPNLVAGLYVDNYCHGFILEDNIVYDNPYAAVFMNKHTKETKIKRNIFVGNKDSQILFVGYYDAGEPQNIGNIVEENVLASRSLSQYDISIYGASGYNPYANNGSSDKNYYVNPYGTKVCGVRSSLTTVGTTYTIDEWKALFSGIEVNGRSYVNKLAFSSDSSALIEVLLLINKNKDSVSFIAPAGYNNVDSDVAKRLFVPEFSGSLLLKNVAQAQVYLEDTFTDANGTSLAAHTPETGSAWTIETGTSTINSNKLTNPNTTNAVVVNNIGSANGIMTAELEFTASNSTSIMMRRVDTNNRITVNWSDLGKMLLAETIAGTSTVLAEDTNVPQTTGVKHTVRIEANAGDLKVYLNGTLKLTGTTTHTTGTNVAISYPDRAKFDYVKVTAFG